MGLLIWGDEGKKGQLDFGSKSKAEVTVPSIRNVPFPIRHNDVPSSVNINKGVYKCTDPRTKGDGFLVNETIVSRARLQ